MQSRNLTLIMLVSLYACMHVYSAILTHNPMRSSILLSVKGGAKPAASGKKVSSPLSSSSSSLSSKKDKSDDEASTKSSKKKVEILEDDEDDEEEDEEDDEMWSDDEDDDFEYDDEEEDDDEEDEEEEQQASRSPKRGTGGRRKQADWHYADRRRRLAAAKKQGSFGVYGLVKGAAKFTGNSMSRMVGLFQPNKYVGLREVIGGWKMKQKVMERPGELERCEASMEIRKDGTVITYFNGKEMKSDFLFKERQWPRTCIIEFEAKAFQGPYDREPQLKFYKGYVRRSLMNANNIRIEGKIYEVQGTWFLRQKKQVGRFRAIKR